MSDLMHVSAAPHKRSKDNTRNIMQDVIIALIPTGLFGIYNFGLSACMVIVISVFACVATEHLYCKFMKLPSSVGDLSAVITGLLLAYNLPYGFPLWMAALGGIFAIIVVKMIFGGIGQNFMNPALAARAFLLISFPSRMTSFAVEKVTSPGIMDYIQKGAQVIDGISSTTPLASLKAGETLDLYSMFLGNRGGTIGETSAIALLIGAAYLLLRRVIKLRIPLCYLVSFSLFILIFGEKGFDISFLLSHLFGGGLLLGVFFMATDYTTSPITPLGQIVFGIFLGLLTGLFRIYGATAEGVSYAIIFGNMLVPLIDKVTRPRFFGKERAINGK